MLITAILMLLAILPSPPPIGIMGWVIDLIMYSLEGRFKASDLFVVPILLFGPPLALLVFGVGAEWAFRGFNIEDRPLR
jgi:hypothetical protein